MHVHHRACGIQQRTWAGQLEDALAELRCALRGVGMWQWQGALRPSAWREVAARHPGYLYFPLTPKKKVALTSNFFLLIFKKVTFFSAPRIVSSYRCNFLKFLYQGNFSQKIARNVKVTRMARGGRAL